MTTNTDFLKKWLANVKRDLRRTPPIFPLWHGEKRDARNAARRLMKEAKR